MRSIRRSLLGYLLLLLALALGAVGAFVDRFAEAAMRDREEAETDRLRAYFRDREREIRAGFDDKLKDETRVLAWELNSKLGHLVGQPPGRGGPGGRPGRPPEGGVGQAAALWPAPAQTHEFQVRVAAMFAGLPALGGAGAGRAVTLAAAAVDPPRQNPRRGGPGGPPPDPPRATSPAWLAFDRPRAVARVQEALRQEYDDDNPPRYFQFHLVEAFTSRPDPLVAVVRSPRLGGHDLPLDPDLLDLNADVTYRVDDVEVPGQGRFRRVILAKLGVWPMFFGVRQTPTAQAAPDPFGPPRRNADLVLRAFVHHARPATELDELLAAAEADRAGQLAQVRAENRDRHTALRNNLLLIGGASFLSLVVGGLLIVARGLAPLRRLSDAVSRVSEKDFRLPVGPDGLSRELLPIHARMTSTLDQLRRAFEREKEAVADISHELRTPIAALKATIQLALKRPRSPDHYRATLEDCQAIAKQLDQLVERILTLASLDAGTARVACLRVDAADVAAACATVIRPLAEAHGLAFAADAPGPVDLDTDPDRLREVLVNLLHNAVEYNRPGGRVDLAVRRERDRVVFEVADTGIGMTPEVREKIFERFYRADSSRHATGVHAGLGLAIVKEYVDRLGGTIAVDTTPGEGTTFRVALPAPPAPAGEPAPPPRREPAAARS